MDTTTFRLATEAELDALAEVCRLRGALAGIEGRAEYLAETAADPFARAQLTKIVETAREALDAEPERRAEAAGG